MIKLSIYVTSDLHGILLKDLRKLLESVNFNENDWLYILGDVIDRQNDGGVEILKWLLEQSNVQLILGNHEAMLLSCDFLFDEITEQNLDNLTQENMKLLLNYIKNGGEVTLKNLKSILASDPETVGDILDYLRESPMYETVYVNGRDFLLVHSGLDNFDKNKKLSDYNEDDFLMARPEMDQEYYEDIITVFGHTPTLLYDRKYKGKILKTRTWINIDVGVAFGNSPVLLRLDDLKEFSL